ncbi:MAG: hypothetical protein LBF58_06860, partial [Deltaproteobacteria bacterium]|nr:hypothetical protein [Deltaproteobacteria bacterium]
YKKDNYDINIYNLDTVKSHPIQSPYIGLVSDKDQHGFVVIRPGANDEAIRDNVPLFSLTCTIEYSDLFGSLCYDTVIKLDGKKISLSDAVRKNPAIRDAIKNSTRSPWNEAG